MNRGIWIAAAAGILGVGLLGLLARGGAGHLDRQHLEEACDELLPGDSLESVPERLGPTGFRPGCGTKLPCEEVVAGGLSFQLSCAEDCSQLWRLDDFSCFVDFDPKARTLLTAEGARSAF